MSLSSAFADSLRAEYNDFISYPVRFQKMMDTILGREHVASTKANRKLEFLAKYLQVSMQSVRQFDLPSGYTCPKALLCQLFSHPLTGKLKRGKNNIFDCYAAKNETQYVNVRALVWMNYYYLLECKGNVYLMTQELQNALMASTRVLRLHSKGDIYCPEYFEAVCNLASNNPNVNVFGYTKVLDYVLANKPDNFVLQYSFGGKDDSKVSKSTPTCFVVNSYAEANDLGVDVICDTPERHHLDYVYIQNRKSFALLVH